jgi:Ca2+-binding EF-hand superfamily protein
MKQLKLKGVAIGVALFGGVAWSATAPAADAVDATPVVAELKATDTNGDGKLSPKEYAAGAKQTLDDMDANNDGKVTVAEMKAAEAWAGEKTGAGQMSAAEKIRAMDRNGDGAVGEVERPSAVTRMFEALDTDADGFASKAELAAGYEKLLQGGNR